MVEHQNIEWKTKWKDEYLEWICGYANAQGGTLYIGVDDNGNVVGIPDSHKLLEDIPNKIKNAISWGRGVEKICHACAEDGVPQPEYTVHPGDIMIKFSAPEDRIIRSVTPRVTEKVTEKEQQLLNLISEDPAYTTAVMANKLAVSRKTIALRLRSLKEKGIIMRIGSDAKGYWKIVE